MHTVSIEIDPHDFLRGEDVARQVMDDALDMLASGRADTAASILANALGRTSHGAISDPEEDRRNQMTNIFLEWQSLKSLPRQPFWEWSHGRRQCP